MDTPDSSHALDHIVLVLFENRSLDNVLGHLYGPDDGKTFEGVIGKNLSNPIPEWAEDDADRKVVPAVEDGGLTGVRFVELWNSFDGSIWRDELADL